MLGVRVSGSQLYARTLGKIYTSLLKRLVGGDPSHQAAICDMVEASRCIELVIFFVFSVGRYRKTSKNTTHCLYLLVGSKAHKTAKTYTFIINSTTTDTKKNSKLLIIRPTTNNYQYLFLVNQQLLTYTSVMHNNNFLYLMVVVG